MRVIDTTTLEFVDFGSRMPDEPYGILSHQWSGNEVTFRQYRALDKTVLRRQTPQDYHSGLAKILWGCHMARLDNMRYFWIDTCCINKNNPDDQTELSSSIMAMWKWYHEAAVCYVYLATINLSAAQVQRDSHAFTERHARRDSFFGQPKPAAYFRRGWTLQELLAPRRLMFFNSRWTFLGTRFQLAEQVHNATNIAKQYINSNESIRLASIAARLSWACGRETTREEDRVYSLIGLFDINMDIRYGEGYERAFFRLQKELIENDPSEDLFAWTSDKLATSGLLAPDIDCFAHSGDIDRIWSQDKEPHQLTSKGMKLHILARLWDTARDVATHKRNSTTSSDQTPLRITLPLAAGRRNKDTKQIEVATLEITCVNSRDSPTRLFVRTGCDRLGFDVSSSSGPADGNVNTNMKRRSQQPLKADEYIPVFVRQEYMFSDAHRKERMSLLKQRFGSFGHDYRSHVYAGAYVCAEEAATANEERIELGANGDGNHAASVPIRPRRSPSPGIGYAI